MYPLVPREVESLLELMELLLSYRFMKYAHYLYCLQVRGWWDMVLSATLLWL